MRNPRTVFGIVVVVTMLITSSAFAFGPCGNCPGFSGGKGMGFGKGLAQIDNLTKEQQAQIQSLKIEFLKKEEALRSQKAQKRIELMDLASKSPQDEAAIQKKKEEIWAIQDQMRNEGRTFGTKIRSLLTPEQREKMGVWAGRGSGFCGAGGCRGFGGGACRGMMGSGPRS